MDTDMERQYSKKYNHQSVQSKTAVIDWQTGLKPLHVWRV